MKINILPVEPAIKTKEAKVIQVVTPVTLATIEEIFTQFLELEVGDGAASADIALRT